MSKITKETEIPINTTAKKEKTLLIDQKTVSKINELIEQKEEKRIIHKLDALKKSAKKIYQEAQTLDEKQKIIEIILQNLDFLLSNVNYTIVYNSDASLGKTSENYDKVNSIQNMVSIGGNNNIEGANCHSWVLYIYRLLKDITNDELNFEFILDKKTNHSILYIKSSENTYIFEHNLKKHYFEKIEGEADPEYYFIDKNEDFYNIDKDKKGYLKNSISYNIGKKYFKIHKRFGILFFETKKDENNFKKINIPGLRYISKIAYRLYKYTKIIGFVKKTNDMFDIKEDIYSKLKDNEEKELAKNFFYNINYYKLKKLVRN